MQVQIRPAVLWDSEQLGDLNHAVPKASPYHFLSSGIMRCSTEKVNEGFFPEHERFKVIFSSYPDL